MYTIENVLKVLIFPLFTSFVILAFFTQGISSFNTKFVFFNHFTTFLLRSHVAPFDSLHNHLLLRLSPYIYLFASLSYILCIRRILEMLAGDVSFFTTDNRIVPCYFFLKFFSSFQRY